MKVLLIHNAYQHRGGEDAVFEDEARLLAERGHETRIYLRDNHEIDAQPRWRSAAEAIWSGRSQMEVGLILDQWQPDVMHVHNTFSQVSPSVIWAAKRRRVAVVATLHNFRLACLEGTFLRQGQICEDCLGASPWRGIARACYRGSHAQSAVLASSTLLHRALGTWRNNVHRFIALDPSSVPKFIAAGLPANRIRVKPNFAWNVAAEPNVAARKGGLFVGRLSPEKGVGVLAQALKLQPALAQLTVIGSGPEQSAFEGSGAQMLGQQPQLVVRQQMHRAAYLVIPSIAQEQFPRVLAEAFAAGLPVIAAARGALSALVEDGVTGLHFKPADSQDLSAKMAWAETHPDEIAAMGLKARIAHAARYSPDAAYAALMSTYNEARQSARQDQTR